MIIVKPKKSLGQHFLTDRNIAQKIVSSLTWKDYNNLIEIGPGTGVLTEYLMALPEREIRYVEIDYVSAGYLKDKFPIMGENLIVADALKVDFETFFQKPFAVIGNFPYNISSQLLFKILDCRHLVRETVCMLQKEVAVRIASPPGSKDYGILSVLLQAYYDIEYLFTVAPGVFNPPPKVQSAVIRLTRNNKTGLDCNETFFRKVVKTAFNQRRKTLRNSLKNILLNLDHADPVFQKRPEQLGVDEFVKLTRYLETAVKPND